MEHLRIGTLSKYLGSLGGFVAGARSLVDLVVSRARLQSYYNGQTKFGSFNKANDELEITVEFRAQVECSGQELTDCRNAWNSLPPLQQVPDRQQTGQDEIDAKE